MQLGENARHSTGSRTAGRRRAGGIPVASANNNGLRAAASTLEAKVASGERAVRVADAAEVAGNALVEANRVAGRAIQVVAEVTEAGVELLKDDSLSLNLANLLGDNPLSHLLKNEETLLDNFNGLRLTDNFLLLLDDDLGEVDRSVKVIGAVEVVKVSKGRDTTPVVERCKGTSHEIVGGGQWRREHTRDDGGGENDS